MRDLIVGLIFVAIVAFVGLFICFSTRDEIRTQAMTARSQLIALKDGLASAQAEIYDLAVRFDAEESAPRLPENRERLGF